MKTTFKNKPRKPLAKISTNPANVKLRKAKKKAKKKVPFAWLKAIPEGSHGSGTLEKRLWRVTSDFVRIRDWYAYSGLCVATGRTITHWRDGQAGHFKAYSKCNGMFKFDEMNIHLQSAVSNSWGDMDDWKAYEQELMRRYKENIIWRIDTENFLHQGEKITDAKVIEKIVDILERMKGFPEQPDYYPRVMSLLHV